MREFIIILALMFSLYLPVGAYSSSTAAAVTVMSAAAVVNRHHKQDVKIYEEQEPRDASNVKRNREMNKMIVIILHITIFVLFILFLFGGIS